MQQPHLFCFGLGYSALVLAEHALAQGWKVSGTVRSADKIPELQRLGITSYLFEDALPLMYPQDVLRDVTHVLLSIPPSAEGDVVWHLHGSDLSVAPRLTWLGYLSTTGVYGDAHGGWVDETTPLDPKHERGARRALAEQQWIGSGLPAHIFRLAGIYGPGRSAVEDIRAGVARRIDKPGHVFCRIHVSDIARMLFASMQHPTPGEIFNGADDCPAPQAEVVAYAAELLGVASPPLVSFEHAELSAMAHSFYMANRRVSNRKIKEVLGVKLMYPSYRDGLKEVVSHSLS